MTSTPGVSTAATTEPLTFVDTNVLVYAHDTSEALKQPMARAVLEKLWERRTGVLSTQVLQEFYVVATSFQKIGMRPAEAREVVETYSAWPVVALVPEMLLSASQLHEHDGVAWWDALIIEAARIAGASRILTEDMQDGRELAGVRIVNPFLRMVA